MVCALSPNCLGRLPRRNVLGNYHAATNVLGDYHAATKGLGDSTSIRNGADYCMEVILSGKRIASIPPLEDHFRQTYLIPFLYVFTEGEDCLRIPSPTHLWCE